MLRFASDSTICQCQCRRMRCRREGFGWCYSYSTVQYNTVHHSDIVERDLGLGLGLRLVLGSIVDRDNPTICYVCFCYALELNEFLFRRRRTHCRWELKMSSLALLSPRGNPGHVVRTYYLTQTRTVSSHVLSCQLAWYGMGYQMITELCIQFQGFFLGTVWSTQSVGDYSNVILL